MGYWVWGFSMGPSIVRSGPTRERSAAAAEISSSYCALGLFQAPGMCLRHLHLGKAEFYTLTL